MKSYESVPMTRKSMAFSNADLPSSQVFSVKDLPHRLSKPPLGNFDHKRHTMQHSTKNLLYRRQNYINPDYHPIIPLSCKRLSSYATPPIFEKQRQVA